MDTNYTNWHEFVLILITRTIRLIRGIRVL